MICLYCCEASIPGCRDCFMAGDSCKATTSLGVPFHIQVLTTLEAQPQTRIATTRMKTTLDVV